MGGRVGAIGLLALGVGIGAGVGCIAARGYPCERSDQCVLDGVQGRCEPVGFCSYPDESCDSEHRFEGQAGNGLGGTCVEAAGTSTGGESGESTTGPEPDMGTGDPCADGLCGCAQQVFAGSLHSCALGDDGQLYCWGGNIYGQLGRDSNGVAFKNPTPVELPGSVEQYEAREHACALLSGGEVYCWGRNENGQSDWTDEADLVFDPRLVTGLEDMMPELISVGYGISCAAEGTTLRCWGLDPAAPEPDEFLGELPGNAVHLATGQMHGCAAMDDQNVYCFGDDNLGQLGDDDGVTIGGSAVVALPPHDGVIDLAAGANHTCAILEIDGSDQVYCWGSNALGIAGAPSELIEIEFLPVPVAVALLEPGEYVALSLDVAHSCVLEASGRLFCWGSNEYGMSDPWAEAWTFGAQEVVPPEGELMAGSVAAGQAHSCVGLMDGRVRCWGCNAVFQLGPEQDEDTCDPEETLVGEVLVPCGGGA